MVIKVTGYSCANTVLYVHGHIRENVAGAWQKFPNEEFQNENKYKIIYVTIPKAQHNYQN